ncbi:MAG: hypothetical protein IPK60_16460 [Sandaracinaceae bacterium]|jgi:hypothetical protein|nr:hypothetical protein [Sandaracinaceae bacterium]
MSTKAEQARHAQERVHPSRRDKLPKRTNRSGEAGEHVNKRAEKNSSYALETAAKGTRPSRKSTRGSANHLKSDQGMLTKQNVKKGSPKAIHARAAAKGAKTALKAPKRA